MDLFLRQLGRQDVSLVSRLLRREVNPKIWCSEAARVEDAVFLLRCSLEMG
jgi:hypothetical protein